MALMLKGPGLWIGCRSAFRSKKLLFRFYRRDVVLPEVMLAEAGSCWRDISCSVVTIVLPLHSQLRPHYLQDPFA